MTVWEQWVRHPQSLWLRKALFQIHLWTGVGVGLYVLFISISGSAIVFRNELYKALWPAPKTVAISGNRLSGQKLRQIVREDYPKYDVSFIWDGKGPHDVTEVWLMRNGKRKERLFNPYTGEDLGDSVPYSIRLLSWLGDLHTNLLAGKTGRAVNGAGAFLLILLSVSGIAIWWPGIKNWRRGLTINTKSHWKRLNWDLHSATGFWASTFLFIWAVTGVFVVFPRPFEVAINRFSPLIQYRLEPESQASLQPPAPASVVPVANESRPRRRSPPPVRRSFGDQIVRWFYYLHFGNFAGWPGKALWVILGLAPPFLFFTGTLMWWNRVLSAEARRTRRRTEMAPLERN